MFQVARAGTEEKQKSDELVKAVEKEIEPLLHDAAPFFGEVINDIGRGQASKFSERCSC
jgi:hypothetical protein